jgi:hypothetical protein
MVSCKIVVKLAGFSISFDSKNPITKEQLKIVVNNRNKIAFVFFPCKIDKPAPS